MSETSTFTGQEEELIEAMAEVVNNEKSTKSKENMNPTGMPSQLFRWHGKFCASRPWEVIFLTLTLIVCLLSLTYLQPRKESLEEYSSMRSSTTDRVILTTARCVALLYTYLQFTRLRRLGSKYLLAIASILTIIFSFGFSVAVITLFDTAFKELNEALPFFFLFIDIPKACTLAKFALSSNDLTEVASNIGEGMGLLGPTLSLDTLTMGLSMGVGMLSGIGIISSISCFSCLSILANYLAFVFFYPACLAITLELIRDNRKVIGVYQLARAWKGAHNKPNLALRKVKVIMCTVLVVFHIHHFYTSTSSSLSPSSSISSLSPSSLSLPSSLLSPSSPSSTLPNIAMITLTQQNDLEHQYWYMKDYKLDTIITAVLACSLIIKYILVDNDEQSVNGAKSKGILKLVSFMEGGWHQGKQNKDITTNIDDSPVKEIISEEVIKLNSTLGGDKNGVGDIRGDGLGDDNDGGQRNGGSMEGRLFSCRAGGVWEHYFKEILDLYQEDVLKKGNTSTTKTSKFSIGSNDDNNDNRDNDDNNNNNDNDDHKNNSSKSNVLVDSSMQTDFLNGSELYEPIKSLELLSCDQGDPIRCVDECVEMLKDVGGPCKLTDQEVMQLVVSKKIPAYRLETALDDFQRGVSIRRKIISKQLLKKDAMSNLPYTNYEYKYVHGACCENVIGYLPIPVGVAGPLLVDGTKYHVPMATTEGCLVASANRGCRALAAGGGVKSSLLEDGMTRAPLVRFSSAMRASEAKRWFEENFDLIADAFNSTSRFARLKKLKIKQNSRNLYIRFVAVTGDAMGMNMLSKGSEKALLVVQEEHFPDMKILSLSSNFCTDKKPNAINWIDGRGKSIVCEAVVPGKVVREVLKTTVAAMVDLNIHKNLVGSTLAGSVGGSNAHAANIVTAIFIATGQDPAQNVCSSNCMTIMEPYEDEDRQNGLGDWKGNVEVGDDSNGGGIGGDKGESDGEARKEVDLYISCNMPSLEVGTIGGGTILPPQAACLEMLGVRGAHKERPGQNACSLARVICSTVMAGELSLMASLTSGDLVKSHLKLNRTSLNMAQPPQCIPI